jgi:MFS-type transporter involved in bile tolerance (Atg22 family)
LRIPVLHNSDSSSAPVLGQAFKAELVPRGREYVFFSLLGIVSKAASRFGPTVRSTIVGANTTQEE